MSAIAEMSVAKRNDVTVKIDGEVIHKAKIVAAYEDKSLAEFLSDILEPIVAQKLAEHAQRVNVPVKPPKVKGRPKE